ncbi:N-acetylmuramoyl-L-alanine amidase [Vampirovibrio sp.]|uniref:N-acetylmuramoyl-L-alanine amidase n=1 Tax=Vampirovibrio sp. TaxID=2717857 RepID=UPI003593D9B7
MVCSPRIKRLFSAAFAVAVLCGSGMGDLNSAAWAKSHRTETQPSALGIVGVRLNSDGSGLTLDANRPFSGTETRNFSVLKLPSPYRILLDIPNARLAGGQKIFLVNQNGIDRVELVETHSAFYSSVRAIVYVNDSQTLARLSPEFEGAALKLAGATPMAMTPAQIASTSFAKTPIGKVAQPLPPVAKPATAMITKYPPTPPLVLRRPDAALASAAQKTVLDVPVAPGVAIVEDVYFRDNKLFVQAEPGATLRIKNRFNLTEPNRLVLELDDAVLRSRDLLEPISTKAQDIRQIRVGQFDDKTVRIVIEGNDPEQCEAIYHGGEKNLLAISPYSSTSITKLSANTRLGEVQSIDLKREGNNTVLRLAASTPIVHRFLKKDDRLVLDLLNQAANPTNIGFDARLYPEIEKMRLEPLNEGQPNSKLAIDFARPGTKVIPTVSDDGKVLELQISVDAVAAASSAFPNIAGLGAAGKAPFPARIVVDAGHGGKDYGAMRGGSNEKDLNLALAMMVRDALEAKGFKVYMTRSTDEFLPLPKITAITNQIHPDLFISIHHNASVNAAANGIETYYYTPQSVAFARKVHAREINNVGARDGGVKKAMFYVIHHTSVPAILCEVGYVSNPSELTALQGFERKSKTARAIADGVVDYLKTRVSAKAK